MKMNPSDNTYGVIVETVAGTTPATPVWLSLDVIPGDSPQLVGDTLESNVLTQNRASRGSQTVNARWEGSLKTQLKRSSVIEKLFASGVSGAWASNVLKASNVDSSLSVEKKMLNGANDYFHRFKGGQVNSINLSGEVNGNIECTFGFLGMTRTDDPAIVSGATYTAMSETTMLTGQDVAITVAGLTADFVSFDLSVGHDREALGAFGSAGAIGIGTSGSRKVKATVKFYREDLSADTLFAASDAAVAVTITIGTGANGWSFVLPAANPSIPGDEESGAKQLVTVEFTAGNSAADGTDFIINKLT